MVPYNAAAWERAQNETSIRDAVEAGALPAHSPASEFLLVLAKAGEDVYIYRPIGAGWDRANLWLGMLDHGGRRVPCAEWRRAWAEISAEVVDALVAAGEQATVAGLDAAAYDPEIGTIAELIERERRPGGAR